MSKLPSRLLALVFAVLLFMGLLPPPALAAAAQAPGAAPPAVAADPAADEAAADEAAVDALLELQADLDALFAFSYPQEAPGATVLVMRDGETLLHGAYGMADLELSVAMTPEMVLRIGSVTKQFTAVALLMLVEEGKVALSDPITRFFPDFPSDDGPITLQHLLTHTSGIRSYTELESFPTEVRQDFTVAQMIERFDDEPRDFAPGAGYAYNNSAYFLLGAVIEQVSGLSYQQFLQQRIFDPLGMEHTYYDDPERVIPNRASGYDGAPGAYRNARYLSMSQPFAAGALLSTVDDLALWDAALYTDRLVSQQTLRLAWTPATLADGRSVHYGYGWSIHEYQGHRILRHGGGIFGFASHVVRIPDAKIFVAVLSNNPALPPGPHELALRAALLALGEPLDARPPAKLDPAQLDDYTGLYEIEGDPDDYRVVLREGDQLFTQRQRGRRFPIFPAGDDRFFYRDSIGELRFVRDAAGTVVGSEWADGGGPAERAARTERTAPGEPQAIAIEPALFDAFVGRYRLREGIEITVSRDGEHFFIQASGQPALEIFAESATRYFVKGAPVGLEFVRGKAGEPVEMILQQGARETRGVRLEADSGEP
jgi:CubicO group peptidase (beta-lactamase class C family)